MVSKTQYQLPRTILLSGVAIVVIAMACSMFLFLRGSHQNLLNNKPGHATFSTTSLNAPRIQGATVARAPVQSPAIAPKVLGPYIDVNPAKGVTGTFVRIRGFKFGANETVVITFGGQVVAKPIVDRFGRFFALVQVPAGVGPGTVLITCTGQTTGLVATFPFNVLPVIPPNIRPVSGRAGTRVFVSGGLFPPGPGDTVTATLVCQSTSCVGVPLGTFLVAYNGTIHGFLTIPAGTATGYYDITFADSFGDTVSQPFTVI
jgi:hypothetical protein